MEREFRNTAEHANEWLKLVGRARIKEGLSVDQAVSLTTIIPGQDLSYIQKLKSSLLDKLFTPSRILVAGLMAWGTVSQNADVVGLTLLGAGVLMTYNTKVVKEYMKEYLISLNPLGMGLSQLTY